MEETEGFIENSIGLKTMLEENKIVRYIANSDHLELE